MVSNKLEVKKDVFTQVITVGPFGSIRVTVTIRAFRILKMPRGALVTGPSTVAGVARALASHLVAHIRLRTDRGTLTLGAVGKTVPARKTLKN